MNAITDAVPRRLVTGRVFGESVRWHNGRVWFSDWGTGEIVSMDADGSGAESIRLPFDAFPFCFDWLPDGRMLIVSSSGQPLLRREADGSLVEHVESAKLAGYQWNEIVVDGRGNAYINGGSFNPAGVGTGGVAGGLVFLVSADGTVRQVAEGIAFPNGMAVGFDNKTLIVAESYGKRLTAFDIGADGGLVNRSVWADLGDGVPDGISMDEEGALWYADVPDKRCVRVREGGEVLQTIILDRGAFSCALGGEDGHTLFIAATIWRGMKEPFAGPPSGMLLAVDL
jgi:sugar lactone lactonase YvrE